MNKLVYTTLLVSSLIVSASYATTDDQSVTAEAVITQKDSGSATKRVYLMDLHLTPKQMGNIYRYDPKESPVHADLPIMPKLPNKALIDMTNYPPLDQGVHGACVTFAATGALNRLLRKADYISQLCSLEFGDYLQNQSLISPMTDKPVYPSGWAGSHGPTVLDQLFTYGFVNKTIQNTEGCSGVHDYPGDSIDNTGNPMAIDEYKLKREREGFPTSFADMLSWKSLLTVDERLAEGALSWAKYDGNKILSIVKRFLAFSSQKQKLQFSGLVTFGVMLPSHACNGGTGAGACAQYQASHDTWVITSTIAKTNPDRLDDRLKLDGHEMIVIGYDDNAVATDENNVKHKGLLILRNSWGSNVGDHGNFYMTYDFFKKFINEVQLLSRIEGLFS